MGIQLNGITGDITTPGDVGIGGTLTYEDVTNVDSIGIVTARSGINVPSGNVTVSSGAFVGDGSQLTGVSGFSTALGNDAGTLENLIFKTTEAFTIGAGQSIRIESDNMSGNTCFTRLGRINVATGIKMAKANDVTISNTGTQLKYKVEFANQSASKETRVNGVSLQY